MNEKTTTSRRPLVPGPSGVAAQAVALREQRQAGYEGVYKPSISDQPAERTPPPAIIPFTGIAKLAAGIAGVMTEVGTIKKGGYNSFHRYHYARLEDLLEAITPLMGKHGVVVIQNEMHRAVIENRIAVTYEFSIIHSSGEVWPERPRFTGMTLGRDSKGNWDDKAINKCHSAARKYFLLSLFQVPSGDFDDADEPAVQQQVPGPAVSPKQPETRERASPSQQPTANERANPQQQPIPDQRPRTVPGPTTRGEPHKIVLGPGAGADTWLGEYLKAISEAKSAEEIGMWDRLNNDALQNLSDGFPALYDQIDAAVQRKLAQLPPAQPQGEVMPDPQADTQESMNWVAQKLLEMKTMAEAETFWNTTVAPQEKMFDDMDWELLMQEWRRTEARLATPPDVAE